MFGAKGGPIRPAKKLRIVDVEVCFFSPMYRFETSQTIFVFIRSGTNMKEHHLLTYKSSIYSTQGLPTPNHSLPSARYVMQQQYIHILHIIYAGPSGKIDMAFSQYSLPRCSFSKGSS